MLHGTIWDILEMFYLTPWVQAYLYQFLNPFVCNITEKRINIFFHEIFQFPQIRRAGVSLDNIAENGQMNFYEICRIRQKWHKVC